MNLLDLNAKMAVLIILIGLDCLSIGIWFWNEVGPRLTFSITSTLYRFLILFEFEYFSRIIKCPSLKLKSFFWTSQKHILWLCFTHSRVSCNQSFVVAHAHSESLGVSCTVWIKSVILSPELNVIWINSCVLKIKIKMHISTQLSARAARKNNHKLRD